MTLTIHLDTAMDQVMIQRTIGGFVITGSVNTTDVCDVVVAGTMVMNLSQQEGLSTDATIGDWWLMKMMRAAAVMQMRITV